MTYEEAEAFIQNKEDEFALRVAQKPKKVRMKRERKAKAINSKTDVVAMI